jgi:hypothetical protein
VDIPTIITLQCCMWVSFKLFAMMEFVLYNCYNVNDKKYCARVCVCTLYVTHANPCSSMVAVTMFLSPDIERPPNSHCDCWCCCWTCILVDKWGSRTTCKRHYPCWWWHWWNSMADILFLQCQSAPKTHLKVSVTGDKSTKQWTVVFFRLQIKQWM